MLRLWCFLLTPLLLVAQSASRTGNQGQVPKVVGVKPEAKSGAGLVPRGYALIIGISKYQKLDESLNLQFPESDAEAVYRVLISQEGGAFPAENVHFLKGPQATFLNISRELNEWLLSVAQPSDRVVVYFSGHGFVKDDRGYLAPYDIDPNRLDATAYPMDVLGDVMANRITAHSKVLLADACHSGKINAETTEKAVDAQFRRLPKSFLTLTAAGAREPSYEDGKLSTGFGVFTYFVVEGLKGAADIDPCDGIVTARELVEYVRANVIRYTRERKLFQTPSDRGDYEPTMALGVSSGCSGRRPEFLFGTLVVEGNMDDIEVYLDTNFVGKVSATAPLFLRGLKPGLHTVVGVKPGYQPDRKEVMVIPDEEVTVTLRMQYARRIKKAALDLNEEGEKLLYTHRSTLNPVNILPIPRSQTESDLKKSRGFFISALREDSGFSRAEFNLGQVSQLLADRPASLAAFGRAIEIDPGYIDARIQNAAVLIEDGDPNQAIRQLTEAMRLTESDEVYALMARAYWDKHVWERCIEAADRALDIRPSNDQAHLWKADCLRKFASPIPLDDRTQWLPLYETAEDNYRAFLRLTNFATPVYQSIAFHFIGIGTGGRGHADRKEAYDSQRSAAFLGVCLCDRRFGNPLRAKDSCEHALRHTPNDAIAHYLTGDVYLDLFNSSNHRCDYLLSAREHYATMLHLNPDINEARNAKNYLRNISSALRDPRLKGCR